MFLTRDEISELTGRCRVAHQVRQLRAMGIPFWVNAAGRPVVTRAAIEGYHDRPAKPEPAWTPKPLRSVA